MGSPSGEGREPGNSHQEGFSSPGLFASPTLAVARWPLLARGQHVFGCWVDSAREVWWIRGFLRCVEIQAINVSQFKKEKLLRKGTPLNAPRMPNHLVDHTTKLVSFKQSPSIVKQPCKNMNDHALLSGVSDNKKHLEPTDVVLQTHLSLAFHHPTPTDLIFFLELRPDALIRTTVESGWGVEKITAKRWWLIFLPSCNNAHLCIY